MAEAVVSLVLDRIVSVLAKEVNLLGNLHKDIQDIKDELESVQSFLKVADLRSEREDIDDTVKMWVKQVREAAYAIEDVVDEYMLRVAQRQHRHQAAKLFVIITDIKFRRKLASKIQEIKITLREIKERCERYRFPSPKQTGSSSSTENSWNNPKVSSHFIGEEDVVGIESTRDELISCLLDATPRLNVISIVGMGGTGKTTVAKIIYENDLVRKQFDCHAWVAVTNSYTSEDLLRRLVRELCRSRKETAPEDLETMEKITLIHILREYLRMKKYVVLFDDVWKADFWGDIEHALLDNNKGSRIIITTRITSVANFCKMSSFVHVCELQPLPPNMAFKLFCKKAFQPEGNCPQELEQLSLDIVTKCKGLPLAIVVIGGLLSTKNKIPWEWKLLLDSLNSESECIPHLTNISKILSLSYHDLPYYLKPCLLYFGIYPEGHLIGRPRLVGQWIAEDFVEAKKGKTLEQVACEYLDELIQRNVVQVSWGVFNGVNLFCHVHDLMRDIILSNIRELNFCQLLDDRDSSFDRKSRRISICNSVDDVIGTIKGSCTRGLFVFKTNELPRSFIVRVLNGCKLLKVLDFEDSPIDILPEEVGDLFHLRYLSVRNTKVKTLPKSIGKLQNLVNLDVAKTPLQQLPIQISKLQKLQRLLAHNFNPDIDFSLASFKGVKIELGIGCLKELQTLVLVDANDRVDLVKELENLIQLRVFAISVSTAEAGKALCPSIQKMNYLRSLEVHMNVEDEILDLHSISAPFQFILDIFLRGCLEKMPHWVGKLFSVVTIGLFFSRLVEDPLELLQRLPNLQYLYLYQAYEGEKLHITQGGFKKLKLLSLRSLINIQTMLVDDEALPVLEQLSIGPSPLLSEVPRDFHRLRALKTMVLYDMPREFYLRMKPNGGEDHWKVAHIQTVILSSKVRGERYKTCRINDLPC